MVWIAAAWATAVLLRHEIEEVFDSSLQETAQRLLPLAVLDIVGREDGDTASQRLGAIRSHDELFTYVVRDDKGKVLLRSHAADLSTFPPYTGAGFGRTATHRLYSEEALQGTIRITVAKSLAHQDAVIREMQMGLGLPVLLVIPTAFAAVAFAVRQSTRSLRAFRDQLETRSEKDLAPVASGDLPSEVAPMAASMNALIERLRAAFEAERSLTANTAHELRTPLAGAIAQAQRIRKETAEPQTAQRGADIEATLKRLTARAERLMQLARAEGGRLNLDRESDLRDTLDVVIGDMRRNESTGRILLRLPDTPVMSAADPDAVGILCRNLVENALRHGSRSSPVEVALSSNGLMTVSNDGPVVPAETLARLADRFERSGAAGRGNGIGLSIVSTIADRMGGALTLRSPRPGCQTGFEASVPLASAGTAETRT
ncbi:MULTISPECIES: ATP-binding protein [Aminobacter]|uniref:histidine kinase n=1 Tax=Aminobacter ciceronei TaxID=150723 RepID=A0ABR6C2I4_9HYPH|nr:MULTISPECIES: ATP-binding protein [Aminobacter]MBA8905241.1 two-component system OmpR family sensor kinase [Aminobacter ciceronei]MBA9018897.1 two-component system OmpR family sensor kinase [Aminobacter ciceronei]